ncbi:uncharacterized protein G2W53_002402 [Senna tora]|uniref:Uncharacterized protein n=1 Tax=Senna tora TaxID=362788 RepID=A0A834XKH8_9FABA|nr:uncharacterized protein G2W53_002402 [Senna tora]
MDEDKSPQHKAQNLIHAFMDSETVRGCLRFQVCQLSLFSASQTPHSDF